MCLRVVRNFMVRLRSASRGVYESQLSAFVSSEVVVNIYL